MPLLGAYVLLEETTVDDKYTLDCLLEAREEDSRFNGGLLTSHI